MKQPVPTGVLLMAYGAVESLSDVAPYLQDIRGGRPASPELVEEIAQRYRKIGGKSPLLEITRQQAADLEKRLNRDPGERTFKVYTGMRHWHPYIKETVAGMAKDRIRQGIALCLTPYYSRLSVGAYFKKLEEALSLPDTPREWTRIEKWSEHPLFLQALSENILKALEHFEPALRHQVPILFSAHSLPARILAEKDPYPQELEKTVQNIMTRVGPNPRHFAYQSKGRTPEPWLGPDAAEVLQELHKAGHRHVLMAPFGFISDHMETLYDVDILYRRQAESLGIEFKRSPSLNTHPLLIEALSDTIRQRLSQVS